MHAPDAADGLPAQTDVTGAMERVFQRLASTEAVSRVSVKTFSTSASVTERGEPDRGASTRRARRCSRNWRSPLCHRRYRQIQFPSHVDVCFALAAQQNDSSSPPPAWRASPLLQRLPFILGGSQWLGGAATARSGPPTGYQKGHGPQASRAPFGMCLLGAA